MIALDFMKAFDHVRFDRLIIAMQNAGIIKDALDWLKSWTYNNYFAVKIGDKLSDPKELKSSVKQGSVLGPYLFIIFINSLIDKLMRIVNVEGQHTTYANTDKPVSYTHLTLPTICSV